MVRQMRRMVADGTLGPLRQIHVEYFDEFLAMPAAEVLRKSRRGIPVLLPS